MRYYKIVSVSTIALSLVLGGCSDLTTRQKNAAAGAAIGGVAGAVLTGGIIGHGVDGHSSKKK